MTATQMSIYIPRMSISTTEENVKDVFHNSNIGKVKRVDFTTINKKDGFYEANVGSDANVKTAFVHFDQYYDNDKANKLIEKLKNDDTQKLYVAKFKYWLLLKAKTVIPDTIMNNHQIVANCQFLENKIYEQDKTIQRLSDEIYSMRAVVAQLIGGLFCHKEQRGIMNKHLDILYNDDTTPEIKCEEGKWEEFPTTRQGDENEKRIEKLEALIKKVEEVSCGKSSGI